MRTWPSKSSQPGDKEQEVLNVGVPRKVGERGGKGEGKERHVAEPPFKKEYYINILQQHFYLEMQNKTLSFYFFIEV